MVAKIFSHTTLLDFFHSLEKPTHQYRQPGNGRLNFGSSGTHYDQNQIEAEGFLRLLWGVGPLAGAGVLSEGDFAYYREAILHSVDPKNPAYWGEVQDYDQLIVEMAALAVTLIETKNIFWDTLTSTEQQQLYNWLNQVNQVQVHPNNWRFFRLLVNVAFFKLDQPFSKEWVREDKELLDEFYLSEGWYFDGTPQQMDYYIPWAFHYYGLLYAHYMKEEDPEFSQKYRQRATLFAQTFKYWFSEDGSAIPFGRSLIYRFAQGAFWSACVYTNTEVLPWNQIRKILLEHFSFWQEQTIQKKDGILSIGYTYENFYMAERYNSPGSPFWSFKAFLLLAVPDTHPFWQTRAKKPELAKKILISPAKMVLTNQQGQNLQLFPVDQFSKQTHGSDKYSKLAYSSLFGFSVGKGSVGLEQTASDSCLAVAEAGTDFFVSKQRTESYQVNEKFLQQSWQPLPGVKIDTFVIPLSDWHLRYHKITTERKLKVADNGFSNKIHNGHPADYHFETFDKGLAFQSEIGWTASLFYFGYEKIVAVFPEPNTNVLFPNSFFFSCQGEVSEGTHSLLSGHYGGLTPITDVPQVSAVESSRELMIQYQNQKIFLPI
ncbi:DUF2264 domain-containing protein [Enterococcus sp. LJL90]